MVLEYEEESGKLKSNAKIKNYVKRMVDRLRLKNQELKRQNQMLIKYIMIFDQSVVN